MQHFFSTRDSIVLTMDEVKAHLVEALKDKFFLPCADLSKVNLEFIRSRSHHDDQPSSLVLEITSTETP